MIKFLFFCFAVLLWISPARASEFQIVGARALGMGGAHVAVADDATAVYWNPAGLSLSDDSFDLTLPFTAEVNDHLGVKDTLDQINTILGGKNINDPAIFGSATTVAQLNSLILKLAQPGTGVDLSASGGVLFHTRLFHNHLALSGLDLPVVSAVPYMDTVNVNAILPGPTSIANNTSYFQFTGLEPREFSLSLSNGIFDGLFLWGGNIKLIKATTYTTSTASGSLFNYNTGNFTSDFKNSQMDSSAASFDLGILFQPASWFRAGVVGRDLNSPKFNTSLGTLLTLNSQVRTGVALLPSDSFTFSADLDLTSNPTFTPGVQSRNLALGLEKSFFGRVLSFRLGGFKNMMVSDSNAVGTAGLGLKLFFFHLDLGGGYDFHQREGLGSATLAFRF